MRVRLTDTRALCAGPSENTHILSLSLMDEEMLAQTHKQNLHPKPPLHLYAFPRASVESFRTWRSLQLRLPSYPLFLSPGSGPTWLSACFPWRLPASVPRLGGGRWERSLRHILSTPEGWGPAAVPPVHRPYRKHLSPAAAHQLSTTLLAQVFGGRRDEMG